ncbi:MAG: hypothetical protein N3F05_01610 [Candidatus Diapherotrites archaeon]|nr:hypothetical protein [Candidatus Diapherotrites archaeon]
MLKGRGKLLLLLIFAYFGLASARVSISDTNVIITDTNKVTLHVECYDENGNKVSSSTNVRYSIYEETNCNDINYIISQSTVGCNTSADIGEYGPGLHCLVIETVGSEAYIHTTFFNINKPRVDYTSIDEGGVLTAILVVLMLFTVLSVKDKGKEGR